MGLEKELVALNEMTLSYYNFCKSLFLVNVLFWGGLKMMEIWIWNGLIND